MRSLLALFLALAAAPAAARDPLLNLPLACTLGEDCYVQNYLDHDGGPGAADFACGGLTYDGHSGTDFALPSLAAMEAGVDVLAAAPGTVIATRDGMQDIAIDTPGAPDVSGRECGNGVVVDHGGGWETQYCHMKQGSIAVGKGQRVGKGTPLGQVGLSGQTEFPHVHLSVRHDGEDVDPFVPDGIVQCGEAPAASLWQEPVPYLPGGLIAAGIADRVPDFAEVKAGPPVPATMPAASPALVVWGYAYGVRAGDEMALDLAGPDGLLVNEVVPLDKTQAQLYRAVGRKARGAWPAGDYTGTAVLRRGGVELGRRAVTLRIE